MAASTAPQTVAGHPIAMKVGGRRMSLSKSPSAQKSFLASSPPKQTEVPTTATAENPTSRTENGATPTSPVHTTNTDDYPRPEGHHDTAKDDKEEKKKEEQQQGNKKKEKKDFEHVKQQTFNKNPPMHNNFNIKQPAGKTL